ncbi:hypothetical protein [Phaeobacter gallaeciensis]|uniref:hypothetical protein n=1 Tax=Phaeobacter gallaeciensis TaxID=60890 RepID=UPI002380ACBA|nr:hypothetical protein [Phaeobacter gallaeciensis]
MINLEQAVANSYRNFHAKGLDYICLSRTEKMTQKLYILDGDASKVPEVVNPHDHRYPFHTMVLHGKMADHRWLRGQPGMEDLDDARVYKAFDYMTPLNGGDGFTYRGEEVLVRTLESVMEPGDSLTTQAQHVHTIQMLADQTVLLLNQFADIYPADKPTSTWSQDTPSISDDGLYERFTEGQIVDRLASMGFSVKEVAA